MKRTLSLVLAVLMVLALFGAAAEDTKKVEIRVNMQAGTGVTRPGRPLKRATKPSIPKWTSSSTSSPTKAMPIG